MALCFLRRPLRPCFKWCDWAYKPGSVLTAIYLAPRLLVGSSHLLGTAGQAYCPTHGVAPNRVYIIKPMSPWAGCALTAPFQPYLAGASAVGAVSLCCTCPGVTPGGRYPLSLPCGARTFLIWVLSVPIRGCPAQSPGYCTLIRGKCQINKWEFGGGIVCSVVANQCRSTGVATPRLNVQPDRLRGKPSPAGEGAERSEAGVEGTR